MEDSRSTDLYKQLPMAIDAMLEATMDLSNLHASGGNYLLDSCTSDDTLALVATIPDFDLYRSLDSDNEYTWKTALTPLTASSNSSSAPVSLNTSPDNLLAFDDRILDNAAALDTDANHLSLSNNFEYTDFLLYPDADTDIEALEETSSPGSSLATAVTTSPTFNFSLFDTPYNFSPASGAADLATPVTSFASSTTALRSVSLESSPVFKDIDSHSIVTESHQQYMTPCMSSEHDKFKTPEGSNIAKNPHAKLGHPLSRSNTTYSTSPHSPLPIASSASSATSLPPTPAISSTSGTPNSKKRRTTHSEFASGTMAPSMSIAATSSVMSASVSPSLTSSTPASSSSKKSRLITIPTSPDQLASLSPSDLKRVRNTQAARRYRQKKVDRMEELERMLAEAEKDRDRWKDEAHRWSCEAQRWKGKCEGLLGVSSSLMGSFGIDK